MTAAAQRKLQKDIDVVLKKVDDGIEEFAQVFEQATTTSAGAQREKLGEELKKSINKLQRLRAQIREWIAQTDIKNNSKDKLEDARKRIENDMQRFKDFERDLKTKAFSTSGLSKGDDLELEELEKMKYQDWLTTMIQSLNDQTDELDAEIETLDKKKSLSADEKSRQQQLKAIQERHRWHINKLEQLLRALDNDTIEMSDLAVVRDSLEMYIDAGAHDSENFHDEALYDCFDLTEFEEKQVKARTPSMDVPKTPVAADTPTASSKEAATPTAEPAKKNKEKDKKKKEDKKDRKKEEREKKLAATTSPTAGGASSKSAASGRPDGRAGTPGGATSPATTPKEASGEKRWLDDINLDEAKVQEDQLISEAEEFICKICQIHVVGCSPKLTNCSHLFCGDCIAQWFAQHPESQTWAQRARSAGPERVVPCPVCKQPLNEKKDLYPVCGATSRSENLLLWRMLSSLKIMCENHSKLRKDGKCDWIGEYGQYQKHIERCKNLPCAENGSSSAGAADTSSTAAAPTTRKETKAEVPSEVTPSDRAAATPTAAARPAPSAGPTTPAQTPQAKAASQPVGQALKAVPAPKVASAAGAPAGPATPVGSAPAAPAPTQSPKAAAAPAERVTPAGQAAAPQPAKAAPTAAAAPVAPAPAAEAKADRLPEGSYTCRAVSTYESSGPNMVTIAAGDIVQVLESHSSGWSYCRNLTSVSAAGWAPAWVVAQAITLPAEEAKASLAAPAAAAAAPVAAAAPAAAPAAPAVQPKAAVAPVVAGIAAPKAAAAPASAPAPAQEAAARETLRPAPAPAAAPAPTPTAAPTQASPAPDASSSPVAPKAPKSVVRAAASSFKAASASQLSLALDDLVEIIERHDSGWTYGRKVDPRADPSAPMEGWFPDWVCAQK